MDEPGDEQTRVQAFIDLVFSESLSDIVANIELTQLLPCLLQRGLIPMDVYQTSLSQYLSLQDKIEQLVKCIEGTAGLVSFVSCLKQDESFPKHLIIADIVAKKGESML